VQVIGSVFKGLGKEGDFSWMIQRPAYEDALFVFNDNEPAWEANRRLLTGRGNHQDVRLAGAGGGGNAVIRSYQMLVRPRAIGVPTGPDYAEVEESSPIMGTLRSAIDIVATIAVRHQYERIVYSAADEAGALGTAIFKVDERVKKLIVTELKSLENSTRLQVRARTYWYQV
jgi:hypothetical protein